MYFFSTEKVKPVVSTDFRLNKDTIILAKSNFNMDLVDPLEINPRKSGEVSSSKLKVHLEVKSERSHCHGTISEAKQRKRTAGENIQTPASPSKRNKTEKKPTNSLRYDSKGHFPEFDKNDNATRCKNENCRFKTHLFCTKCNIHLCLTTSRNCFKNFHLLSTE